MRLATKVKYWWSVWTDDSTSNYSICVAKNSRRHILTNDQWLVNILLKKQSFVLHSMYRVRILATSHLWEYHFRRWARIPCLPFAGTSHWKEARGSLFTGTYEVSGRVKIHFYHMIRYSMERTTEQTRYSFSFPSLFGGVSLTWLALIYMTDHSLKPKMN